MKYQSGSDETETDRHSWFLLDKERLKVKPGKDFAHLLRIAKTVKVVPKQMYEASEESA